MGGFWFLSTFKLAHKKVKTQNPRLNIVPCPYCNHPKTHSHGSYFRKGTHLCSLMIIVLRYLCIQCHISHSVLPNNVLPIIRWTLPWVKIVQVRFQRGDTIYRIAKDLGVSKAVIRNLENWLISAPMKILVLTLAEGLLDKPFPLPATTSLSSQTPQPAEVPQPAPTTTSQPVKTQPSTNTYTPIQKLSLPTLWPNWRKFVFTFSRSFYPKRFLLSPPHTILTH